MLRPMPSPRGTNVARRYIVDRSLRGAAYDEAPKDAMLELLEFLRGKLSDSDLGKFCEMAGIDGGTAMDDERGGPVPFKGMPQRGGTAMDAKSFAELYPHAARIKVHL